MSFTRIYISPQSNGGDSGDAGRQNTGWMLQAPTCVALASHCCLGSEIRVNIHAVASYPPKDHGLNRTCQPQTLDGSVGWRQHSQSPP